MAHALGTGDAKSLNLELNLVPFIDLMSCLTAFLMVSAMWVHTARLEVRPAGRGSTPVVGAVDVARLSVLIDPEGIWVGVAPANEFERIPKLAAGYDWGGLAAVLARHRASSRLDDASAIEVAAESVPGHPVAYQQLIAAMDIAIQAGFVDVGITDPQGLSARPQL
ncbi:MAG TPA: biopolymer transporter ExbD [Kofleriaceae bacterium]|nr:biopolymer transporter ExbD [Kofleriaceae bacterium]